MVARALCMYSFVTTHHLVSKWTKGHSLCRGDVDTRSASWVPRPPYPLRQSRKSPDWRGRQAFQEKSLRKRKTRQSARAGWLFHDAAKSGLCGRQAQKEIALAWRSRQSRWGLAGAGVHLVMSRMQTPTTPPFLQLYSMTTAADRNKQKGEDRSKHNCLLQNSALGPVSQRVPFTVVHVVDDDVVRGRLPRGMGLAA